MARKPRHDALETRNTRLGKGCPPRKEPYWRQIIPGTFLGYARGSNGSAWIARQRSGSGYVSQRIGTPDDYADADGEVVLTYSQAVEKAQKIQVEARVPQPRHYGDGLTIGQIVDEYITDRTTTPGGRLNEVMSEASAKNTRQLWGRHAGRLDASLATAVSAETIKAWHAGIAKSAPTKRGRALPFDPQDSAQASARRQSANRVLTILKAALQHARDAGKLPADLPDYWRRVKPFKAKDDELPRMLEKGEITRLLNAASPDLRDLLTAALMTGARYGEVTSLRVGDYVSESSVVRLKQSKTGKVLWQPLTPEGVRFFERVSAGRGEAETMFLHADGRPWGKSDAARPVKAAAEVAKVGDVSFKVTRATYGKLLLLATKDLELVAKALGHADSRITRRHYAALLPSEVQKGVAKLPSLGIEPGGKVRKIR